MAAVAENSDRIAKIFNNRKEYAKDGKFEVNLWSNGERFRVTFDDQIPVDP